MAAGSTPSKLGRAPEALLDELAAALPVAVALPVALADPPPLPVEVPFAMLPLSFESCTYEADTPVPFLQPEPAVLAPAPVPDTKLTSAHWIAAKSASILLACRG